MRAFFGSASSAGSGLERGIPPVHVCLNYRDKFYALRSWVTQPTVSHHARSEVVHSLQDGVGTGCFVKATDVAGPVKAAGAACLVRGISFAAGANAEAGRTCQTHQQR